MVSDMRRMFQLPPAPPEHNVQLRKLTGTCLSTTPFRIGRGTIAVTLINC